MDHEKIIALACGRYFGSFALLVATDQRLLLIDKRVFFMTIEDTRYDMISEIDYNSQVYSATVTVYTLNKTHKFNTIKYKRELRELTTYVQRRVMEFRNQQQMIANPEPAQPRLEVQSQVAQPTPVAAPADYYVDRSSDDRHVLRNQVGHVAHLVGTAATRAAHHHRPIHPYTQGSLMTRHPMTSPTTRY
ncbi:PH domain-containing protein [Candidatus Saccharibacteria bacterium]|nr:PH domain-containing protein [Candidatus Saccharibacteria bacterium]